MLDIPLNFADPGDVPIYGDGRSQQKIGQILLG